MQANKSNTDYVAYHKQVHFREGKKVDIIYLNNKEYKNNCSIFLTKKREKDQLNKHLQFSWNNAQMIILQSVN